QLAAQGNMPALASSAPIDLVVPIDAQVGTNQTQSASGGQQWNFVWSGQHRLHSSHAPRNPPPTPPGEGSKVVRLRPPSGQFPSSEGQGLGCVASERGLHTHGAKTVRF